MHLADVVKLARDHPLGEHSDVMIEVNGVRLPLVGAAIHNGMICLFPASDLEMLRRRAAEESANPFFGIPETREQSAS